MCKLQVSDLDVSDDPESEKKRREMSLIVAVALLYCHVTHNLRISSFMPDTVVEMSGRLKLTPSKISLRALKSPMASLRRTELTSASPFALTIALDRSATVASTLRGRHR